jgi:hypothetical protein
MCLEVGLSFPKGIQRCGCCKGGFAVGGLPNCNLKQGGQGRPH